MPLATRAATPTAPIVPHVGTVPCSACQITVPITHRPKSPIETPFTRAALARQRIQNPAPRG